VAAVLAAARRRCPSFGHPKPATSPPRALLANGRVSDPLPSPGPSRSSARKMTPKEELAQLTSARTESGAELLAELGRHRLPSAAERCPSPSGSSEATSLPRSRWSTRTCASSSRSPSTIAATAFRSRPRPDPGGNARLEPRGREVQLAARLQVLDLRSLVDPPGGRAHDCEPGEDDPPPAPRRLGERPRKPRPAELAAERIERILDRAWKVVEESLENEDARTRLQAARETFDRILGKRRRPSRATPTTRSRS
jgi:hypothetical protein